MISVVRPLLSLLLVLVSAKAFSEECGFLGDPLDLQDRQVYVQISGTWKLLTAPIRNLGPDEIQLAYVFREKYEPGHRGALVIKSARVRQSSEQQRSLLEKSVRLQRHDGDYCRGSRSYNGSVTAKSYDDYHDRGAGSDPGDYAKLKTFHAGYTGRRNVCKDTDDSAADLPNDLRNNRGQFSFDPNVVSAGTYFQVADWTGVTTAYASSENLDDQNVQIKPYETVANMPSCLRITLPKQDRTDFVRISDLEGRIPHRGQRVRSREYQWNFSQPR